MNNAIDNVSQSCEQAKTFVEEHAWQVAALAAYPVGGAALLATQFGKNGFAPAAEGLAAGATGLASLIITDQNANVVQDKTKTSDDGLKDTKAPSGEPSGRAVDSKDSSQAAALESAARAVAEGAVKGAVKGGALIKSEASPGEPSGQALDPKDSPQAAGIVDAAKKAVETEHH